MKLNVYYREHHYDEDNTCISKSDVNSKRCFGLMIDNSMMYAEIGIVLFFHFFSAAVLQEKGVVFLRYLWNANHYNKIIR